MVATGTQSKPGETKKWIGCCCGVAYDHRGIELHVKGCGSIDPFFTVQERKEWTFDLVVQLLKLIGRMEAATGMKGGDVLRDSPNGTIDKCIVIENEDDFASITSKWVNQQRVEQWVYNFLEKKEAGRIIFENPDKHNGYILALDLTWNGIDVNNMHLLAVFHRNGIKSIRDLTANDLPMLENVRLEGLAFIRRTYDVKRDQIVVYFEYQPASYHLHMHIVLRTFEAPANGITSAILLDDVITNLKAAGDYYKRAILCFTQKTIDKLLEMFLKAGRAPSNAAN